jgi:hypothetical protein
VAFHGIAWAIRMGKATVVCIPQGLGTVTYSDVDHDVIRVRCLVACFDKELLPDEMIEVALDNIGSVEAVVNYLLTVMRVGAQ